MALGKVFLKKFFAECQGRGTRQSFKKNKKNSLLSAADMTLGKEAIRVDGRFFCQVLMPDMWHSANKHFPTGSLPSAIGALPSVPNTRQRARLQ
jgi:hypothetical protein